MSSTETTQLTVDMVPAVRAAVVARRVWVSILSLLAWGLVNGLVWHFAHEETRGLLAEGTTSPVVRLLLGYGVLGIAAAMVLFALYGAVTRHVRAVVLGAVAVILVGLWNIFIPLLILGALTEPGVPSVPDVGSMALGAIQLIWGVQEYRKYLFLCSWSAEAKSARPEEKWRVKHVLKAFLKGDEDFFAGRIRAVGKERQFLSAAVKRGYRGQLFEESGVLVSRHLKDMICFTKGQAAGAIYTDRASVTLQTDVGKRRLALGPVSVLAMKSWAGVAPNEKDITRVVSKNKASVKLLGPFLAHERPDVRAASLRALKRLRSDPEAVAVASEKLADSVAAVRAAALEACRALRVADLTDRVTPMLRDEDPAARRAAAEYIAAYPKPSAAKELDEALALEEDKVARSQMTKALKSCERAGANPYQQL